MEEKGYIDNVDIAGVEEIVKRFDNPQERMRFLVEDAENMASELGGLAEDIAAVTYRIQDAYSEQSWIIEGVAETMLDLCEKLRKLKLHRLDEAAKIMRATAIVLRKKTEAAAATPAT